MQTVNTVTVTKATSEQELGFSLFGPSFGLKGTIKKVQGRHAAIRLLVQLSMIQVIGKYLILPYWQLLPDAEPDPVVIDSLKNAFFAMDDTFKIAKTQQLLFLHGHDVFPTKILDDQTKKALQAFDSSYSLAQNGIDLNTFMKLYLSIPISDESLQRLHAFNKLELMNANRRQEVAPADASKENEKSNQLLGILEARQKEVFNSMLERLETKNMEN